MATIDRYYGDVVHEAGKALKDSAATAFNNKIGQLTNHIATLERQAKDPLQKGRIGQINKEIKKYKDLKKDLQDFQHRLKGLTNSVAIKNLVEDVGIRLKELKFEKRKFWFFKIKTNTKIFGAGDFSHSLMTFDKRIDHAAREIDKVVKSHKKQYKEVQNCPVLAQKVKDLEALKGVFADPGKGLQAARRLDNTLNEADFLKEQRDLLGQGLEKDLEILGEGSPPFIINRVLAEEKEIQKKLLKLEKKYSRKLMIPASRREFEQEVNKLSQQFANKMAGLKVHQDNMDLYEEALNRRYGEHQGSVGNIKKEWQKQLTVFEEKYIIGADEEFRGLDFDEIAKYREAEDLHQKATRKDVNEIEKLIQGNVLRKEFNIQERPLPLKPLQSQAKEIMSDLERLKAGRLKEYERVKELQKKIKGIEREYDFDKIFSLHPDKIKRLVKNEDKKFEKRENALRTELESFKAI